MFIAIIEKRAKLFARQIVKTPNLMSTLNYMMIIDFSNRNSILLNETISAALRSNTYFMVPTIKTMN